MSADDQPETQREDLTGTIYGFAAFAIWGVFPIYWRMLQHVPPLQLVCHRIVWSFLFLLIVVAWQRRGTASCSDHARGAILCSMSHREMLRLGMIYTLAAILISINWLIFIWSVNTGHVVEASLGYYLNPLLSVLLGVIVLRERLSRPQSISIAMTAFGVMVLGVAGGTMPWIAMALAASFSSYGLVKKLAPLPAIHGLLLETLVLLVPAAGYLAWTQSQSQGVLGNSDAATLGLLMLGGIVTVIPLAMFAFAAKRIRMSTIGILQYVGPTIQFLLGVLWYGEPFGIWQAVGFVFIWSGSLVFTASLRKRSQVRRWRDAMTPLTPPSLKPATTPVP